MQSGGRVLLRRTAGFDLHSVREYEQGESLRKVHWRTTARRGSSWSRSSRTCPHDEVAVLLDADKAAVVGESFDVQVRAAGSILRAHVLAGHALAPDGDLLAAGVVPRRVVRRRVAGRSRGAGAAEPTGSEPWRAFLDRDASAAGQAAELVVVTGALDAQLTDALLERALARRPTALVLVETAELRRRERRRPAIPALLRLHPRGARRDDPEGRRPRRETERLEEARAAMARTAASAFAVGLTLRLELGPARGAAAGSGRAAMVVSALLRRCCRLPLAARKRLLVARSSPGRSRSTSRAPGRSAGSRPARGGASSTSTTCSSPSTASRIRLCTACSCSPSSSSRARRLGGSRPQARFAGPVSSRERGGRRRSCRETTTSAAARFVLAAVLALVAGPPRGPARSSSDPCRDRDRHRCAPRLELGCDREEPVRRLGELGILQQARQATYVSYVWSADYEGIEFPNDRTRVLHVPGSSTPGYLRATTLDSFTADHWGEDLFTPFGGRANPVRPHSKIRSCPPRPASPPVDAGRRDGRRPARRASGRSEPAVQYDTRPIIDIQYAFGGVVACRPRGRAPTTRPGVSRRTRAGRDRQIPGDLPALISAEGATGGSQRAAACRPSALRRRAGREVLRCHLRRAAYRPLYAVATASRGQRATTPTRRRSPSRPISARPGRFVYDENPPRGRRALRRSSSS